MERLGELDDAVGVVLPPYGEFELAQLLLLLLFFGSVGFGCNTCHRLSTRLSSRALTSIVSWPMKSLPARGVGVDAFAALGVRDRVGGVHGCSRGRRRDASHRAVRHSPEAHASTPVPRTPGT